MALQKKTLTNIYLPKMNIKSIRVIHIRKKFQSFYSSENKKRFKIFLQKWYYLASHSQSKPIKKVTKTSRNIGIKLLNVKDLK